MITDLGGVNECEYGYGSVVFVILSLNWDLITIKLYAEII